MVVPKFRGFSRLLLLWLICLAGAQTSEAQSWTHAPLVDYDQASEDDSWLWKETLAGSDEGYTELIERIGSLWNESTDFQQLDLILSQLNAAASSRPERVDAYYLIGKFHYTAQKWQECAQALETAFTIDPGFRNAPARRRGALETMLGSCQLYAGNYESAIAHFKRILTLEVGADLAKQRLLVEQRLGEAYMALGRLDEAIEFLTMAAKPNGRREARYSLAVALDRAERIGESQAIMRRVIKRDYDLDYLLAADHSYAPASDEHYYLGLAYSHPLHKKKSNF